MIPLLLIYIYKKKGKNITRAAKKVLSNAKARKVLRKAETDRKPIRNVYRKFRNRRFNRRRTRN
jgi:hypothetical protein